MLHDLDNHAQCAASVVGARLRPRGRAVPLPFLARGADREVSVVEGLQGLCGTR